MENLETDPKPHNRANTRRAIPLVGLSFYQITPLDSETERYVMEPSYIQRETASAIPRSRPKPKSRSLKPCLTKPTLLEFPKSSVSALPTKLTLGIEIEGSRSALKSPSRPLESTITTDFYRVRRDSREAVRPSSQYSPYRIAALNLNCKVPASLIPPSPKFEKRKESPYISRSCFTPHTSRLKQRRPSKISRKSIRSSMEQLSMQKLVYSYSSSFKV